MVGHGGSSAGSYLADLTSLIPSLCASIVVTSTLRVNTINITTRLHDQAELTFVPLNKPQFFASDVLPLVLVVDCTTRPCKNGLCAKDQDGNLYCECDLGYGGGDCGTCK